MNERLKELLPNPFAVDYQQPHEEQGFDLYDEKRMLEYGQAVVKETLALLQKEWYDLNNIETQPGDTPRDIALRVGAKSEIIKLIHKIQKHYGVKQ